VHPLQEHVHVPLCFSLSPSHSFTQNLSPPPYRSLSPPRRATSSLLSLLHLPLSPTFTSFSTPLFIFLSIPLSHSLLP